MRLLNHTWVKNARLEQMKDELTRKKSQMKAALEFVSAITQGSLGIGIKTGTEIAAGKNCRFHLYLCEILFNEQEQQLGWRIAIAEYKFTRQKKLLNGNYGRLPWRSNTG